MIPEVDAVANEVEDNVLTRGANDASRARVQLSSTRTQKLESEFDSSSKARELEK